MGNIIAWVRKLGAGWYVQWRDAAVAKIKAAFMSILDGIEADAQPAAIAAFDAGKAAASAKLAAGGSIGDAEVAARDAVEASLVASGKALAQDVIDHALASIMAEVEVPAVQAAA